MIKYKKNIRKNLLNTLYFPPKTFVKNLFPQLHHDRNNLNRKIRYLSCVYKYIDICLYMYVSMHTCIYKLVNDNFFKCQSYLCNANTTL